MSLEYLDFPTIPPKQLEEVLKYVVNPVLDRYYSYSDRAPAPLTPKEREDYNTLMGTLMENPNTWGLAMDFQRDTAETRVDLIPLLVPIVQQGYSIAFDTYTEEYENFTGKFMPYKFTKDGIRLPTVNEDKISDDVQYILDNIQSPPRDSPFPSPLTPKAVKHMVRSSPPSPIQLWSPFESPRMGSPDFTKGVSPPDMGTFYNHLGDEFGGKPAAAAAAAHTKGLFANYE